MSQPNNAVEFDLTTPEGVLAYVAPTPFASSRAESLSGGNANFIFRLHLNTPYEGHQTLVLKHAQPYLARAPAFPLPVSRQVRSKKVERERTTFGPPSQHHPPP
jgi:5-methylthioribose kinase